MNRTHRTRRIGAALAVFAWALLGLGAWAPAAFASTTRIPDPGGGGPAPAQPAPVHTIVVGGMPGWQIALIATGAALLAAVAALLVDRARRARRDVLSAAA